MNNPLRAATILAASCLAFLLPVQAEQTGGSRRLLAADDSTRRLAIIGPDGTLEWETKVGAIHDAWVLPNGNVLLQLGWTRIVEMTRDQKMVWEYDGCHRRWHWLSRRSKSPGSVMRSDRKAFL